jgi:hypothetical protein
LSGVRSGAIAGLLQGSSSNRLLTPIGLRTYTRRLRLAGRLPALEVDELAAASARFVLSDGAKFCAEEKVAAARSDLETVRGFPAVNVVERETNDFQLAVVCGRSPHTVDRRCSSPKAS